MQLLDYSQSSKRLEHESNGDHSFVLIADSSDRNQPSVAVFAVADGVSACGITGAPLSSRMALQVIRRHLAPIFVDLEALSGMEPIKREDYFSQLMTTAILAADQALWNAPEELRCTVSLAILFEDTLYCANVGDSPIYLVHTKKRRLRRCFECHNEAAQLVKTGTIPPKEALNHEGKYRLLHAVGGLSRPDKARLNESDIFIKSIRFTDDHVLLIGSDGALDVFDSNKLIKLTGSHRLTAEQIRQRIFKAVCRHHGHDDCTLIVVRNSTSS